MRRIGAGTFIACIVCCAVLATTACSSKKLTVAADDTMLVATASGPTPTPLANGLRAMPTPVPAPAPASAVPTPTPVPAQRPAQYAAPAAAPSAGIPRKVIEEFYDAMLAKRNIAAFLTPELRAKSNGDGYALLGAQPPMRFFSVDGQEMSADGTTATVSTTLSVANGTAKPQFAMKQAGDTWLISGVTG
jgi:hypothetical protein